MAGIDPRQRHQPLSPLPLGVAPIRWTAASNLAEFENRWSNGAHGLDGSPISARTTARSWFGFVGFIRRGWRFAVPGGKSDTCAVIIKVREPSPTARSAI